MGVVPICPASVVFLSRFYWDFIVFHAGWQLGFSFLDRDNLTLSVRRSLSREEFERDIHEHRTVYSHAWKEVTL